MINPIFIYGAAGAAKSAAIWSLIGTTLAGCTATVPAAVPIPCECPQTKIPTELSEPKTAHALEDMAQILDEIQD